MRHDRGVNALVAVNMAIASRCCVLFFMSWEGAILTRMIIPWIAIEGIWIQGARGRWNCFCMRPPVDPLVRVYVYQAWNDSPREHK